MADPIPIQDQLETSIRKTFGNDVTVSTNFKQEVFATTGDKAARYLSEFKGAIEARHSWNFPAGTLVAIVTTYITADFRNALGFSAEWWSAIYFMIGALCLVWILKSFYKIWQTRGMRDIDRMVERLKGSPSAREG